MLLQDANAPARAMLLDPPVPYGKTEAKASERRNFNRACS